MRAFDSNFVAALNAAPDEGLIPVRFFWVVARNRSTGADVPLGFWSGSEDITITLSPPDGGSASRTFKGSVGLSADPLAFALGLDDQAMTIEMDHNSPDVRTLVYVHNVRHAYCELYVGLKKGNVLVSAPQLEGVGVVDEAPIDRPAAGGSGTQRLYIRDEFLTQLTDINPAKSSDAHQKRRLATDRFSEYSGVIADRQMSWYTGQ